MNASGHTQAPALKAPKAQRRLLLVESSPGDPPLAGGYLAQAYTPVFEIHRAATLAEAMRILASHPVDAILLDLDLGLPDASGIDTVRQIRAVDPNTPIIVASELEDEKLRIQALAEGVVEVFTKQEANTRLFWRSILQIVEHRREHRSQLQALLDTAPDAILVVNYAGEVRYVNRATLDLFGRTHDEMLGETLGFSVRDAQPSDIVIQRAGVARIGELRVVPMEWHEEPTYLAVIRDVTTQRQAEALKAHSVALELENQRILEANRLKTRFLANMSHELRTPLNAIIGFSEILRDGMVDPASPKYKEFLGHVLNGGKHLLRLINDVLDLAKIEAGKVQLRPEQVDLKALTHEVVAMLGSMSEKRGIRIDMDIDPDLTDIHLDPGRFKQVLYNYLSNAVKFSPQGEHVLVRIQAQGVAEFRVAIKDTGPGIAAKDLGKLFSEFQQLDAGLARQHQGTGLGLALTKRLVEVQGGSVGVISVLGQGSEFFAVFPRQTQQEAPLS